MIRATAIVALVLWAGSGVGCAGRTPSMFPQPAPDLAPPELPEIEAVEGECSGEGAMVAGDPAPFVDAVGVAECNAVVLPTSMAARVYRDAQVYRPYYEGALEICQDGRQTDRAHAERAVGLLTEDRDAYRREATILRVVAPAAVVAAVVVGVLIGVGLDDLAEGVP